MHVAGLDLFLQQLKTAKRKGHSKWIENWMEMCAFGMLKNSSYEHTYISDFISIHQPKMLE